MCKFREMALYKTAQCADGMSFLCMYASGEFRRDRGSDVCVVIGGIRVLKNSDVPWN